MGVALDAGSTFDVSDAKVSSDGHFSGVAKLDLAGKTGELSRKGATISASDISLTTPGLTIVDGRATGPLELSFRLPARVPVRREVPDRRDPREEADARLPRALRDDAQAQGRGRRGGEVTGTYVFKAPWEPIEQAALRGARSEVAAGPGGPEHRLRDRSEDVPSLRRILLHARDRGHGREEVENGLKKLFSQFCAPIASANLVVDKAARAFASRTSRSRRTARARSAGVINFLAPFLTKSYSEHEALPDAAEPAADDRHRCAAARKLVEIGGTVDWEAGEPKPEIPPEPQPVVVEPEKPPGS